MAPVIRPDLTGVSALVALMGDAQQSGVVADIGEEACGLPLRADAELLSLCREALGCVRIAVAARDGQLPDPWEQKTAHRAVMDRLSEASRAKDRIVPRIIALKAVTAAGASAKARVIGSLFDQSRGQRVEAVKSLVEDVVAMLDAAASGGKAGVA